MLRTTRELSARLFLLSAIPLATFGGCGLSVPEKDLLSNDAGDHRARGSFENNLAVHVKCEIQKGLYRIWLERNGKFKNLKWFYTRYKADGITENPPSTPANATSKAVLKPPGKTTIDDKQVSDISAFGTSVNLTVQVEEQSGLTPGVSLVKPLENGVNVFPVGGNVITPQNVSVGLGGSATAHSTRAETIQFTYANFVLLHDAVALYEPDPERLTNPARSPCNHGMNGIMIQSDLKLDQFIYDKAVVASFENVTSVKNWNPFNTFEDQITFTASYGGSVTPSWKFVRTTVDQNSTLLSATRSEINTAIITMGPLDFSTLPNSTMALQLKGAAQAQHTAASIGASTAQQTSATTSHN
jgi:hypothetical protein